MDFLEEALGNSDMGNIKSHQKVILSLMIKLTNAMTIDRRRDQEVLHKRRIF